MKRALIVVTALALAVLFPAHDRAHGGVAVAATPTPAALQYDEITRMILPPATPPPPGNFQTDYQAATAAGSSDSGQKHGLGSMLGNIMGGGNPSEMMDRMTRGNVTRYTYYKGWIRTDLLAAQTATISKCDQHQYITLDLAKKTYVVQNSQPACPTTPGMPPSMGGGGQQQRQPGTADMTISGTSNNLGALAIDGIDTTGYDQSMQMSMTNATGSCRNSNFSMAQTKYISQIHIPRAYCPLPKTMTTGGMMTRASGGGCEPRMHASGSMAGMGMSEMDKLVMYMRMAMGDQGRGMNMVVERGNVKWFGGSDADALFSIPAGFTQQS